MIEDVIEVATIHEPGRPGERLAWVELYADDEEDKHPEVVVWTYDPDGRPTHVGRGCYTWRTIKEDSYGNLWSFVEWYNSNALLDLVRAFTRRGISMDAAIMHAGSLLTSATRFMRGM